MIGIGTPINHSKIPRPMMKLLCEGVSAERVIGIFVARLSWYGMAVCNAAASIYPATQQYRSRFVAFISASP